jgi:hypothetical protein
MLPSQYKTARRPLLAVVAGVALTLAAAACSEPTDSTPVATPTATTVTEPSRSAPPSTWPTQTAPPDTQRPTTAHTSTASGSYSLIVGNSFVRRPGDYLWIEGALPEIVLESGDGTRATKIGSFGTDVVFDHLEPGPYTVRPAARPCDGNCDRLDARVGECQTVVQVPETTRLIVEHSVGRPCAVATS